MKIINFSLSLLLIISFSSCLKQDKPITLPPKGDGQILQVDMGETYLYQYFINLAEGKIVHVSESNTWDLAFETKATSHGVYINDANHIGIYPTGKTLFETVSDSDAPKETGKWKVDESSGEMDSTAIGNWKLNNQVYIIKLNKAATDLRKFQLVSENAVEYKIRFAYLNANVGTIYSIPKIANQNFAYFSFASGGLVDRVEPDDKTTWDLQFCTYNHTFYDQNPPLPYSVTGVLLNPTNTSAYHDSLNAFTDINSAFINSINFSTQRDAIGYNWKSYDQDKSLYTVVNKYNYLIKNQSGYVFKLRFLDFYSSTGVKGSPKFEFQAVN